MSLPIKMAQGPPPTIQSFSQHAIAVAVAKESTQHVLTLYPLAAGVLGAGAIAVFGLNPLTFALTAAGFGGSAVNWIVNYCFRFPTYANRYLLSLYRQQNEHRQDNFLEVSRELKALASVPGLEELAGQGGEQFDQINAKCEGLRSLLGRKLDEGELTYVRFAGTAEQVYLATLDNLRDAIDFMTSWKAMGRESGGMLENLERIKDPTDAQQKQLTAQRESMRIRQRQLKLVTDILTANEEALTDLDRTIADVAEARMKKGEAAMSLEEAIWALRDLAGRVRRYSDASALALPEIA